ncbi:C40 family peptidase [Gemmatimonas sp.]|uniref:C40 family peptidase n=1 Tax=Gemmatimonas sp. TaxID=1962908 RepID=UPI0031BD2456|nr:C40 family peptidase [Gemmatimonas sp.]
MTRLSRTLLPVVAAALVAVSAAAQAQDTGRGIQLESKKPFAQFSASAERVRDSIVSKARGSVGTRYRLGGTKPGVGLDCSGLVRYAMSIIDVVLPRTAHGQSKVGAEVPKNVAALKPGDVLTFGRGSRISHVGIYVGDGKMVHASTSQRRVIETSLNQRNPLIRQWKGVRRFVDVNSAQIRDSLLALADSLSR